MISKHFSELSDNKISSERNLSEKADWYLEMMLTENNDTNSSVIEKLIVSEFQRLNSKGIMKRDPF